MWLDWSVILTQISCWILHGMNDKIVVVKWKLKLNKKSKFQFSTWKASVQWEWKRTWQQIQYHVQKQHVKNLVRDIIYYPEIEKLYCSQLNMTISLFLTLVCLCFLGSVNSACVRDTYGSLPPMPGFPTTPYSGALLPASNYVQNHWSEMAKIGNYRPPNTMVCMSISFLIYYCIRSVTFKKKLSLNFLLFFFLLTFLSHPKWLSSYWFCWRS